MAPVVYILCFLTSLACAVLLLRGYGRSGVRLLLWSGLAFVGIALNNGMLFLDEVVFTDFSMSVLRTVPALAGVMLLLFGLIWEAE